MVVKLAIRVDSGSGIGNGHVGRCLVLAKALRRKGIDSVFISRPRQHSAEEMIRNLGFRVEDLASASTNSSPSFGMMHADYLTCSQEEDANATNVILSKYPGVGTLVVDHYGIGRPWDEHFYESYKIFKIDDLADRAHLCHGIVDQNYYIEYRSRYSNLTPKDSICLLGPQYALIRSEYAGIDQNTRRPLPPLSRILVSFGGRDHHGYSLRICQDLLSKTSHEVTVMGENPSNLSSEWLGLKEKYNQRLKVLGFVSDTEKYLRYADLFIGAAGSITWERFACGLPGIVYSIASNQVQLAGDLAIKGLHKYGGDIGQYSFEKLALNIECMSDPSLREIQIREMMALVDGLGAERIISGWQLA